MKGQVTEVFKIYDSRDKELVIPVYQRNYDWQERQCKQLLDDLQSLIRENRPKHFFGAVVGKPEGSWKWVVIDGQQRLTTVSILMLALAHLIENGTVKAQDESLGSKIIRGYLLTELESTKPKFRLKPVKNDADAYRRLFGPESELIESSNVTANYRYFMEQIPETGLEGEDLWNAICALEVMHLDLEEHDDPQRIFESLNSTGLELSESDKVRNLVLMGLSERDQNTVYEDYWNRIEQSVDYNTDAFLRWYLVTKTSVTPRLDQVYEAFKSFALKPELRGVELLSEVRSFADIYRRALTADTGIPIVDRRLKRLNILKQDVILPFLMPLLEDQRCGRIDDADVAKSLQIVESYLFRRFVSGYATNALNKTFATLYKDVSKLWTAGNSFSDVLAYSLTRRVGSSTFPADEAFAEAFQTRDFYNLRPERRRYLFECLENADSNEIRDVASALEAGNLTIEHVMPQTLTSTWTNELGKDAKRIHEVWLHRIGNLTVTGYNSMYSNLSFSEKKNIEHGFSDSPYRLNRIMGESEKWLEQDIVERGKSLTKVALKYWEYPETSFVPPRVEHPVMPLGEETSFTNRDVTAFEFETASASVANWRELLVSVLRECIRIDRDAVFQHARRNPYTYRVDGHFEGRGENFLDIVPGLEVYANSSTETKATWIRRLFTDLEIDSDSLVLTLRGSESLKQPPVSVAVVSQYAAFSKFVDRFPNVEGSDEELTELLAVFASEFASIRVDRPVDVLGTQVRAFLADKRRMENATADELIALISSKMSEAEQLDDTALEKAAKDGSLNYWLKRLVEVG